MKASEIRKPVDFPLNAHLNTLSIAINDLIQTVQTLEAEIDKLNKKSNTGRRSKK